MSRSRQHSSGGKPLLNRRSFISWSAATATTGGLVASTLGTDVAPKDVTGRSDPYQPIYRETDHIREFYRLSRF